MNTNELIEFNNKLIAKLQKSMMSSANKHLGQRYIYFDTYAEKHKKPPYRVRVTVNGEFVSNKSFKDLRPALIYRDQVVDEQIARLEQENAELRAELEKAKLAAENPEYVKAIKGLIKRLSAKDMTNKRNDSGQKYIHYDRCSNSGMYGVRIHLKDEILVDKRFPNVREAKTYRDRAIKKVLAELNDRLAKFE